MSPPDSSRELSPGIAPRAFNLDGSLLTTEGSFRLAHSRKSANGPRCATASLDPIARAPTARPSASSRPCSGNGPTVALTLPQQNAVALYRAGFTTTISTASTPHSEVNHRCPE